MPLSEHMRARMEELEKEMTKPVISEKEKWFKNLQLDNDFPTEKRANNIKSMKRELGRAKRESKKKVKEIMEERLTEYSTSKSTQENINRTFQDLELTAKAPTFSEWCNECGCIHLEEMMTETHGHKREEEAGSSLYTCLSCERIPALSEVNGFFTEEEVVKFKLKHKDSAVEWGKELVICKQCEKSLSILGEDKSVFQDPNWKLW